MFNALNRFISRLDGDAPGDQLHRGGPGGAGGPGAHGRGSFGFQVLRNTNLDLAVEPWFDFIVGINGRPVDNADAGMFAQEVRNCAGGSVTFGLWNAKGQRTREMHIAVPRDTGNLGLTLQWTPIAVAANVWHVLDVPANSPADEAGLLPYGDYVLGSPEGTLHGESGLGELVEDHIGRPLRLYVYNNEYDVTREVSVQPSRDWGGEGALGCVLGYGALHRLPPPLSEPVHAPGETMFDGDMGGPPAAAVSAADDGGGATAVDAPPLMSALAGAPPPPSVSPGGTPGDFVVPAQMGPPPMAAGTTMATRTKKKDRHHGQKNLMDDYFKEEEKKSRELDGAPRSGRGTPLPPPPKGGPPRAGSAKPEAPQEDDVGGA